MDFVLSRNYAGILVSYTGFTRVDGSFDVPFVDDFWSRRGSMPVSGCIATQTTTAMFSIY
jgi:hypothetical protein